MSATRNRTDQRVAKYTRVMEYVTSGKITVDDYYKNVLELACKGMTNPEIAQELGVTRGAIENVLNRASFKVDRYEKKQGTFVPVVKTSKAEREQQVIELYDEGYNYGEIALALGISRTYVSELAKEHHDMVTEKYSGDDDWVIEYRNSLKPKYLTEAECRDFCQRAERAIILRRLARGWNVGTMASADRTKRGVILRSCEVTGLLDLIPEEDRWTQGRNGSKIPYESGRTYWDKSENIWNKPHVFD